MWYRVTNKSRPFTTYMLCACKKPFWNRISVIFSPCAGGSQPIYTTANNSFLNLSLACQYPWTLLIKNCFWFLLISRFEFFAVSIWLYIYSFFPPKLFAKLLTNNLSCWLFNKLFCIINRSITNRPFFPFVHIRSCYNKSFTF